ncbi:hypothetical protein H6758_00795 [Candidatus Nomurabacteria bacterium]|nr:hypothetical protein [Candidatus Nomurabacteria bacterium]
MNDKFIKKFIGFIAVIITALVFFAGYKAGELGWWWAGFLCIIVFFIVSKLVEV